MIPYGRHQIDQGDIDAVVDVLKSDWLTTGEKISEFEAAVAGYTGGRFAVAVSSGTAALHCTVYGLGIHPGDEVIVPAITFAATANCVIALGGRPVIVDVDRETLLIDVSAVENAISPRTVGIIAVDYAGQPCNYPALRKLADRHHLFLVSDSCHALGARFENKGIAEYADAIVFSFHPVKHITTGEGGAVVTNDSRIARRARRFRNNGISTSQQDRQKAGTWLYEVVDLGLNYRLTDFQCALGLSQLARIEMRILRRQAIARQYDQAFRSVAGIQPLATKPNVRHVYHLYVVRIGQVGQLPDRHQCFNRLKNAGIGVNVHYIPLNLHPFYQKRAGAYRGQCPVAENEYEKILSLPIFPAMSDGDVDRVVNAISRLPVSS